MASPKEKLIAAIDEFDSAVKGDHRYSRVCDQLYEIRRDLDRMPDPREEPESPGRRAAREAGAKTDQRQGHLPPQFMRRGTARERA